MVKDASGEVTGLTALATWFLVLGAIGMAWGLLWSYSANCVADKRVKGVIRMLVAPFLKIERRDKKCE